MQYHDYNNLLNFIFFISILIRGWTIATIFGEFDINYVFSSTTSVTKHACVKPFIFITFLSYSKAMQTFYTYF